VRVNEVSLVEELFGFGVIALLHRAHTVAIQLLHRRGLRTLGDGEPEIGAQRRRERDDEEREQESQGTKLPHVGPKPPGRGAAGELSSSRTRWLDGSFGGCVACPEAIRWALSCI